MLCSQDKEPKPDSSCLACPAESAATAALLSALLLGCSEGQGALEPGPSRSEESESTESAPRPIDQQTASRPVAAASDPQPVEGRYRGFNLQGMYKVQWNMAEGFGEADFELMRELGFNYARLPLDYLAYADSSDWLTYRASGLDKIDVALELGQRYGVHISLNLHQAPGYCANDPDTLVIPPSQDLDLWADGEAQEAFVAHWRMLARRYQQIGPEHLSFNLVNEPSHVEEDTYLDVMQQAIDAIREVTPERPIVLDGLNYGRSPLRALRDTSIIQSLHTYDPFRLTHYAAPWVEGSENWPVPEWPQTMLTRYLYGPWQESYETPLVIQGDFPAGTQITIHVRQVSIQANLVISADKARILEQYFEPGPGEGEWAEVIYREESDAYQNLYDRQYTASLPAAAERLSFELTEGDWLSFHSIQLVPGGADPAEAIVITPQLGWGVPQTTYSLTAEGTLEPVEIPEGYEDAFDWSSYIDEWIELQQAGFEVVVGEFGVYNQTPHEVTLGFLQDLLAVFDEAGFGWCLWELSGPLGPFDSRRTDVTYEELGERLLDRQMLELLQAH